MRRFAFSLLVASGLVLMQQGSAFAQFATPEALTELRPSVDRQKLSGIVEWLKADVASGRVPGAVVLIARDGNVLLHEAVGWSDKDKQIPMQKDSIHPIASSTKLIVTVAALRLIEQNKIKINSPVAAYLPELKDLKVGVEKRDAAGAVTTELVDPVRAPTVHDLFTHRAGFTCYFFPKNALRDKYREFGIERVDTQSADEMLQKLGTLPLAFQPGSQFEYSIATDLLGHIVERVTKKPLDAALKELVLDPLKMNDTTFHVQGDVVKRLARPNSNDPDLWVYDWLNLTQAPKRFSGGAGMASTAGDYYKLLQMVLNGGASDGVRLLSPMTVRWAMANQIGTVRGVSHPGDCYSWNLFNPVRVCDGAPGFPGSVGDIFWGGITGPRYFVDPKEKLIGIVFMQGPSQRAAYHAELRAMVYGALGNSLSD